jgi:tRNA wybutosine-synthesizing protein 1
MIPQKLRAEIEKQQYRIVGNHSAVKICNWTKRSIKDQGFCYKQKFYGIESHRCLQMTPDFAWCTNRCLYCWRSIEKTLGNNMSRVKIDEPEDLIQKFIQAQRVLLSGLKGYEGTNLKKWKEAQDPRHAAISLSGEPTLYPKISELIEEFHRSKMTTFLVTNGQVPERLGSITEPTQLYLSLDAPDKETYKKIDKPQLKDFWERLNKSLDLMNSFSCRKVIRLTLVKGLNMKNEKSYAKLIRKANPDFIECKGYTWVGFSRLRLKEENMPSHQNVKKFAEKISSETGYKYKDEQEVSRVVLLG